MRLVPTQWNIHIRAIQCSHRGAAEELKSTLQVGTQNLECARHAGLASRGQTIGIGPSAQNSTSSETKSLGDVSAATNASIHQYFDLSVHCIYDFWQDSQRSRDA